MNSVAHYLITYIFLFFSLICNCQTDSISVKEVNSIIFSNSKSDSITNSNTIYELVIVSNTKKYLPLKDTTSYIKCSFINKSEKSVIIDTSIFNKFRLFTCNHRWPLYLWKFEINNYNNSTYTLKPNEEMIVFKATLNNICFSDKYSWNWIGHPAPPSSPISRSFSGDKSYLDETCLFFAYKINEAIVLSNRLRLKLK